jgi:hypothetical protein
MATSSRADLEFSVAGGETSEDESVDRARDEGTVVDEGKEGTN